MLSGVARAVLLWHQLPGDPGPPREGLGTLGDRSHFDWMIEPATLCGAPEPRAGLDPNRPAPGSGGLISFRVDRRIDARDCAAFHATRLPPHREAYLDYEGDVSGGRGRVLRIAAGTAWGVQDQPHAFVAEIDWGMGVRIFSGSPRSDGWWFEVRPI